MRRNLLLITACFAAGLFGANVQPILTGAGKILFPETSPSASLSASSGALTVAAGGSNKPVILSPSGSGSVQIGSTTPPTLTASSGALAIAAAGTDQNITLSPSGAGLTDILQTGSDTTLQIDGDATQQQILTFKDASSSPYQWALYKPANTDDLALYSGKHNVTALYILGASGFVGVRGNTSPAYAIDAIGDINATGVYRLGGLPGLTGLRTFRNSAGTGTCTITFSGGIATASTC